MNETIFLVIFIIIILMLVCGIPYIIINSIKNKDNAKVESFLHNKIDIGTINSEEIEKRFKASQAAQSKIKNKKIITNTNSKNDDKLIEHIAVLNEKFKQLKLDSSKNKEKNEVLTHKISHPISWDLIEQLNHGLGVNRENCYVDERGYLRWIKGNRLVHRDVAFDNIYMKSGRYPLPFSYYDVHHINHNKFDNQPENLQLLTRKQHRYEHE